MDLETEALLFAEPNSLKRRKFEAALFWEKSLKLRRDVQIYGALVFKTWLELESDPEVAEYNEAPLPIFIADGDRVVKHQFAFAVRRQDGVIQVIDVRSAVGEPWDGTTADMEIEGSESTRIKSWCDKQDISHLTREREYFKNKDIWLSNIRRMLKFVEITNESREPLTEEKVALAVAKFAPITVRNLLDKLDDEETLIIGCICRGILTKKFQAPIDRRGFDGMLVIDVAES